MYMLCKSISPWWMMHHDVTKLWVKVHVIKISIFNCLVYIHCNNMMQGHMSRGGWTKEAMLWHQSAFFLPDSFENLPLLSGLFLGLYSDLNHWPSWPFYKYCGFIFIRGMPISLILWVICAAHIHVHTTSKVSFSHQMSVNFNVGNNVHSLWRNNLCFNLISRYLHIYKL